MEFFCPVCKNKHPVTDIAADLSAIAREEIVDRIGEIADRMGTGQVAASDTIGSVHNELCRYFYDKRRSGRLFLFTPAQIRSAMGESLSMPSELEAQGVLQLTLSQAVQGFSGGGRDSAFEMAVSDMSEQEREAFRQGLDRLLQEHGNDPVFSKKIRVLFERAGEDLVLDHIEDENGDPFSDPDGKMLGYLRACPHCGSPLGWAVGRGEEIVIALFGGPRSGKSSVLFSMIEALRSGRYADLGLRLRYFRGDDAMKEVERELASFTRGFVLNKTPVETRSNGGTLSLQVLAGEESRVLTFIDLPGEIWTSSGGALPELFVRTADILTHIDCIWLTVDKVAAYGLDQGAADGATDDRTAFFRGNGGIELCIILAELKGRLIARGRKIPPVALIVSKADLILDEADRSSSNKYGLFPEGRDVCAEDQRETRSLFLRRGDRPDGGSLALDEKPWSDMAGKVRRSLLERDASNGHLLGAVERNCPYRTYISLSAFGHPVARRTEPWTEPDFGPREFEARQEPVPPTPYHVLFPLVWTLAIHGAMPIRHRCTWRWRSLFQGLRQEDELVFLDGFRWDETGPEQPDQMDRAALDRQRLREGLGDALLMRAADPDRDWSTRPTLIPHRP
ncbi:MAG: hypothetical protein IK095_04405 [Oscillospiraceae bacterium]|nr:hypothetical protein [Oscillospiraceae bacterium]